MSVLNLETMKPVTDTISEESMMMIKCISLKKEKGLLSEMSSKNDGSQDVAWCATHFMKGGGQDLLKVVVM